MNFVGACDRFVTKRKPAVTPTSPLTSAPSLEVMAREPPPTDPNLSS